ncbi:hypothetical protein AB1Y20_023730 [Prymnesium parvum]|uniref:Uncharacterized protein n=1 Tax=Prymnesium parvum TaxID=97485 RepID=A0AB34JHQ8_PRYPA
MAAGRKRSSSGVADDRCSKREAKELKPVCFPETVPFSDDAKVFQLVEEDDAIMPFGQKVPEGRIFKRECYEKLMSKVFKAFERNRQVLLTGTPGVGKSLFGLLFLLELIRRIRAVRAHADAEHASWLTTLGGCIVYQHKTSSRADSMFNTRFYVIDAVTENIFLTNRPPSECLERTTFLIRDGPCDSTDFDGYTFWASSPRPDDFQRCTNADAQLFYMPAWTEAELIECWQRRCAPASLFSQLTQEATSSALPSHVTAALEVLIDFCELELVLRHGLWENEVSAEIHKCLAEKVGEPAYQEAVLRRWIADLGPVARRAFDPKTGYRKLGSALRLGRDQLEIVQLASFLQDRRYADDTSKFNDAHALLIVQATPDFDSFSFSPSSPAVGKQILSTMLHDELETAQTLLWRIQGTNKGLVFEPLAHHLLRTSNNVFTAYRLAKPKETMAVQLGNLQECKVEDDEICQPAFKIKEMNYYMPTSGSFPVVEAWTSHYLFQMTVSSLTDAHAHPIKSTSKLFLELLKRYEGNPPKLIFVLPKSEEKEVEQMKPQALVRADGKPLDASTNVPQGGRNNLEQFVLFL